VIGAATPEPYPASSTGIGLLPMNTTMGVDTPPENMTAIEDHRD
jgi:hypothetical protein